VKLIIVESPAKAKALRGFLGREFRAVASMGHIRDLPPKKLGVDVAHQFTPTYHYRRGGKKVAEQIKETAAKASAVYLATDPDREGEAIAWHVLQAIRPVLKGKDVYRITFHEITPEAVKAALKHPSKIDMDLVNAQQARRILDRLVGYQVSPVLWKAVQGRGLSAGRVQTVALRLVVERDRTIENYEPDEYWTLEVELSKIDDERHFRARLVEIDGEEANLKSEAEVERILDALEDADYRVCRIRQEERTRWPYPPYTTSTLQRDAANRLHWNASKTMRVAQQLYEGVTLPGEGAVGLITYMRTDSTDVAESAQQEARDVIDRYWGQAYLPQKPPHYRTKSKVAQEAHEAIRPTSAQRTPRDMREHLSSDQAQLYELIWRRFIASQMKPACYRVTLVDVACAKADADLPYLFRASGKELVFPGFTRVYPVKDRPHRKEDGAAGQDLPPLSEREPLEDHGLFPEQHFTKPPSHFTESSLIKELEKRGIGRPSTYAGIIRTLLKRSYVERKRRKSLEATGLGFVVCDFLVEQFPELFAVGFTAGMEDDLDRIARGDRDWVDVLDEFYEPFEEALGKAETTAEAKPARKKEKKPRPKPKPTGEQCPECGGAVVVRRGKYGRFRGCANFPKCRWTAPVVVGACPKCGGDLVERKGKRGVFWGCSGYPECKYRQSPSDAQPSD